MKTSQEYTSSLDGLAREVYLLGEHVTDPVNHPILRPSLNALAMTYQLAEETSAAELMHPRSGLDGSEINLFTSIHASTEDLIRKVKALRLLGQKTGTCFQRCVGWDALNTVSSVTYEVDQAKGTRYARNSSIT